MPKRQLQDALRDLESALEGLDNVDAETRESLVASVNEVQRQLSEEPHDELSDELTSASDRLRDSILGFETSHPHLTELFSRITTAFANLGI